MRITPMILTTGAGGQVAPQQKSSIEGKMWSFPGLLSLGVCAHGQVEISNRLSDMEAVLVRLDSNSKNTIDWVA